MRIKNLVLIIIILAVAAGVYFYFQRLKPADIEHQHDDLYYCPMHPQITSDKPGNCPICFMKLVKRVEKSRLPETSSNASIPGYSSVSVDPQKQRLIGVKTAVVEKKMLTRTIRAFGYVAHDLELYEAQLEYIEAWREYFAYLSRRPVKDEFRTDWREYALKDASSGRFRSDEKRKAQERLLKAEYELKHLGLNDDQLAKLREIKYGQPWIQPDLLFFDEGNPQWVYAKIFESDLGYIDVGQKALITIPAYQEKIEGIVRNIAEVIDPESRTTQVRIELLNYRGELKVNMFADIEMPVEFDHVLVVPKEAILDAGKGKIIFIQQSEGVFQPRYVQTGLEGGGMINIKSGLKEGERIVVSGNFLIDSESQLQAALEGFSSNKSEASSAPSVHAGHGGQ